jgi:hypothetical protein
LNLRNFAQVIRVTEAHFAGDLGRDLSAQTLLPRQGVPVFALNPEM